MTLKRKIAISFFAIAVAITGLEIGESLSIPGVTGVVSEAYAIIGMPLTPLSVAGVARRTTRRTVRRECAVGVVYC